MMKKRFWIICLIITSSMTFAATPIVPKEHAHLLNMATYNIRLASSADTENKAWNNRKEALYALIRQYKFDVLGLQEALAGQETDLVSNLSEYEYYGAGRTDGTNGERVAIMYRKDRFAQELRGMFWLSPTPNVPGIGWDAGVNRICVWIKLREKMSGKAFYVFSTHLDVDGAKARLEGAKLILERIKLLVKDTPVFCIGDMNCAAETDAMKTIAAEMNDSYFTTLSDPTGSFGTYNGFNTSASSYNSRIDFIYSKQVDVFEYKVPKDKMGHSTFPSDHFPVVIKCALHPGSCD